MTAAVLEELKSFLAFSQQDAANLRELAELVQPHLAQVVERFCRHIASHPGTWQVLTGGAAQRSRLFQALTGWLSELFCGRYDHSYARRRAQIGSTHVRVGLRPHFMIASMQTIWEELERIVRSSTAPDREAKLASLHKLLMLETGLILESYREGYANQIRQVEREAMLTRLRQAEQLAEVGQLAASLAHEVKNPLAGISGAIQVIRDSLKPGDAHRPVLAEVLRQINRLDRSVSDLLVFSRPQPPQYQRCDLPRVAERVLALLRKEPEFERVRFECELGAELSTMTADEHQLEQLLMNLLLNAAQASTAGGPVRLTGQLQDGLVRLVVEDRGCGMTEEVARRAMEPFFTTKARGTGLGLSICRKIAEAHGGSIAIRTRPGEGTAVTVELSQPPSPTGAENERSRFDRGG